MDVHPQTRLRFDNQKDKESVELLDILYKDEITHVEAGLKWFQYACNKHDYVREDFQNNIQQKMIILILFSTCIYRITLKRFTL